METKFDVGYKLMGYNKIVIAGHINPDGDAIGACLAMGMALKKAGKEVFVLLEPFSNKYNIIPGNELLCNSLDDNFELDAFIALDCGNKERLGFASVWFDRAPVTLNIDHHESNTNFATFNCVDPLAAATCELLFDILIANFIIDSKIASALYAGIVYDTGGLKHSSISINTFHVISELIKFEIPFNKIYNSLISIHSFTEAKLLAKAINNAYKIDNIIVSSLTSQEIEELEGKVSMLDGIIGFLMDTENMKVALFFYEKEPGTVKISLRSQGDINVSKVAELFSGGGHINAAGATFHGSIDEARTKVLNELTGQFSGVF